MYKKSNDYNYIKSYCLLLFILLLIISSIIYINKSINLNDLFIYNIFIDFISQNNNFIIFKVDKLMGFLFAVIGFLITILSIFGASVTAASKTLIEIGHMNSFIKYMEYVLCTSILSIILILLLLCKIISIKKRFAIFIIFIINFVVLSIKLLILLITTFLMFKVNLLSINKK